MLEKLHSVYGYNAYHNNGLVTHGGNLNKSRLIKFELIPQAPYLPKITIDLSNDRELIFYKRIFCRTDIGPYNIDYHVGYIKDRKVYGVVVNGLTGKLMGQNYEIRMGNNNGIC